MHRFFRVLALSPALISFCAGAAPATTPVPSLSHDGGDISILWGLPFVLLLACIALMPFVARRFWEHHYPKVAVSLATLVAGYYFFYRREPGPWLREMVEYISFIILLGSLFVVSGGISIRVNRKATPSANASLLLIGAIIANFFGTTGAAMLLIRPYLRMNRRHIKPYHIVFFIFCVANVGGSLTPIGDPPLFLGYLKGVPFWWVSSHMIYPWLLAVGLIIAVFFVIDTLDHKKEEREHDDDDAGPQVHLLGAHNFLFIAVIAFAVFRPSLFEAGGEFLARGGASFVRLVNLIFSRELLMLAAAVASRRLTPPKVYTANDFAFGPIKEVAILFVGIFSTMVPALQWLEHNAQHLAVKTPGHFYFASGSLSSVLDNAPTYVTFLQTRIAGIDQEKVDEAEACIRKLRDQQFITFDPKQLSSDEARGAVEVMIKYHEDDVRRGTVTREQIQVGFLIGTPAWSIFIVAISAGSVFWGACTYIGNGPNFMVKSIADAAGVKTPGFVPYIYKYTLPILIPIYLLVWLVFFAGHRG